MNQALSGLKVLDLSMNLPGPYMTWLLALLGAEVVKIENPDGGDYARALGGQGHSPLFAAVNRNKKSVTLNLKHSEGRRLFLELLKTHDVLVEGFRPGTMERFDLGFDVTSAMVPRLIHVSISGYGHDGPYRLRAGHDINYLAMAGILGMTGTRDGQPAIMGVQVADLAGGSLLALSGLLAAIIQRQTTGRGQFVDTAMFDGSLSLATMVFGGVEAGLEQPRVGQMLLNGRFPCYNLYQTADGKHMTLGALEFKFWQNFCVAVGRDDLLGQQFGGPEAVAEVEKIFASRSLEGWIELMRDADACCEPLLTLDQAVETPLVQARRMVNHGPDGHRYLGCPIKMSDSHVPGDLPAPALGEHTAEILAAVGVSPAELDSLKRQGIV